MVGCLVDTGLMRLERRAFWRSMVSAASSAYHFSLATDPRAMGFEEHTAGIDIGHLAGTTGTGVGAGGAGIVSAALVASTGFVLKVRPQVGKSCEGL